MVRRIGYGEDEKPEKPHKRHVGRDKRVFGIMPEIEQAKSAKEKNRRTRLRRSAARLAPLISSDDSQRTKSRARWFIIAFLLVWLTVWSYGIYTSVLAFTHTSGAESLFLMVWIGGASVGWAFAVVLLIVMIFGKEKKKDSAL